MPGRLSDHARNLPAEAGLPKSQPCARSHPRSFITLSLLFGLHSLGHRDQSILLARPRARRQSSGYPGLGAACTKLRSIFELIEGQGLEVKEAGVAGAEVVQRQPAMHRLHFSGHGLRNLRSSSSVFWVISTVNRSSRNPPLPATAAIWSGSVSSASCSGERLIDRRSEARHQRSRRKGLFQQLARKRIDESALLNDGNKGIRRHGPSSQMVPPRQSFKAALIFLLFIYRLQKGRGLFKVLEDVLMVRSMKQLTTDKEHAIATSNVPRSSLTCFETIQEISD